MGQWYKEQRVHIMIYYTLLIKYFLKILSETENAKSVLTIGIKDNMSSFYSTDDYWSKVWYFVLIYFQETNQNESLNLEIAWLGIYLKLDLDTMCEHHTSILFFMVFEMLSIVLFAVFCTVLYILSSFFLFVYL